MWKFQRLLFVLKQSTVPLIVIIEKLAIKLERHKTK